MSDIIKASRAAGLFLVCEDSGTYRVLVGEECIYETKVRSAAEIVYFEEKDSRSTEAKKHIQRENEHYSMQAVRSDSFERRTSNARKTGGKGGRGGV